MSEGSEQRHLQVREWEQSPPEISMDVDRSATDSAGEPIGIKFAKRGAYSVSSDPVRALRVTLFRRVEWPPRQGNSQMGQGHLSRRPASPWRARKIWGSSTAVQH